MNFSIIRFECQLLPKYEHLPGEEETAEAPRGTTTLLLSDSA